MGFWDDVKRFFTGDPPEEDDPIDDAVHDAMVARMQAGQSFSWVNIADAVRASTPGIGSMEIAPYVDGWVEAGLLGKYGYEQTEQTVAGRTVAIFHLTGAPFTGAPAPTTTPARAAPAGAPKKKKKKKRRWFDPWDAGDLMSLTATELRARAMKIVPWRTAWIGRVDVIPPQSDERTALVDRGLVLRGFFTEEEIEEIHRVGDLWLKHKDAAKLARATAAKNADAALAQLREEAKQKKARLKEEAKQRAERRRAEVAHRKATDIVYLGRGVSGQLHDRRSNIERLEAQGLPLLAAPADVADALGVTVSRLRWLAFHDEAAPAGHYTFFEIPKRSGGTRLLSAPKTELRAAQSWIHEQILKRVELEAPAHGFVPGRSTVTNAAPHVGRDVVVNLDLESFFPTITFGRVRGLFTSLGYSPAVATVLALLTTEAPRRRVTYAGRPYFVAVGRRALPQGACTSPALSNLVARKLDRRMTGLAKKLGWTYTRYADDLTFSAPAGQRGTLGRLLAHVRHVVQDEGFRVNEKKGRVQRKGGRQTVTGIVVNERLAVPREEIRTLRAILHNAKKTGLAAQNRDERPHFEAWLRGKIAYVAMVDPERGAKLAAQLAELGG